MSFFKSERFKTGLQEAFAEAAAKENGNQLSADDILEILRERVIGQDDVAARLAKFIARRSKMKNPTKTRVTALLSGPTGVGKTEMAKALAHAVYGNENAICVVPCNSMGAREESLFEYFGVSKSVVGASRGRVCDFIDSYKKGGVILFDEYEKAAPTKNSPLGQTLLTLLDEGKLTTRYDGSVYDARKFTIILTSNAEQERLAEAANKIADQAELEKEAKRILKDTLAPEFLGRMNIVSTFRPLDLQARGQVAALHLNKVAKAYEAKILEIENGVFNLLVIAAEKAGQMSMREVNDWIEEVTADAIEEAVYEHGYTNLIADYDIDTNTFSVEDADAAPAVTEVEKDLDTAQDLEESSEHLGADEASDDEFGFNDIDLGDVDLDDDDDDKNREVA